MDDRATATRIQRTSSPAPRVLRTASSSAGVYRRRRMVAAVVSSTAIATLGLGVHTVLTGPGGVPASAAGTGTATGRVERGHAVVAARGDSLWSIAQVHRGGVDLRRYVDALVDLNGGSAIEAGQLVRLP